MEHGRALTIAQDLLAKFTPDCHRAEYAGSLRRKEPSVNDIEIVTMPILALDMFDAPAPLAYSAHDATIARLLEAGILGLEIKGGQRYKQFALPQGINLDLFIVRPPAQWGVIYAIRTGPEAFSRWLVTKRRKGGALPSGYKISRGGMYYNDTLFPMPEERDFLDALGLGWIEPAARSAYVLDISKTSAICPGHKGHMSRTQGAYVQDTI